MKTITLTTDYGLSDWYSAALKGVIGGIAPDAQVIDVTHDIEAHDVQHAAFVLARIWPCFRPGTIHVAVVDPGVGTTRRILAGMYSGQFLVAPDNGLAGFVHVEQECQALHVVQNARYFLPNVSSTFHGRDIMAPVAAHLANGVALESFGPQTESVRLLDVPARAAAVAGGLQGRVIYVDRFGTLVSNIGADQITAVGGAGPAPGISVSVASVEGLPLCSTFADVPPGEVLTLIGGSGRLEVAINQGRAVDRFGRDPRIDLRRC